MARGDRRTRFRDDRDRSKFLGHLAEGAERYGVNAHCYVLMVNHQAGSRLVRLFWRPECLAHFGFPLISGGSKGVTNDLSFSLLTYGFALTYKSEFKGIFILWEKDIGLD
jgi:hypothetical protein